MNIRNRVKSLRMVPASDLRPNPKNWRTHPKAQADALRGVLAEVGLADACLARELPDGSLMLIDGHLRAETLGDGDVPVLILDVNEAEADKILATLDPLAAMADSDAAKFEELLHTVNTSSQALQELIAETAAQAGLYEDLDKPLSEEGDEPSDEDEADEPPPSGVRMVQLFLDESNIGEFQDACTKLAEEYATENITDTVLEAVRRASASL
jgi:ParB-like chromosome segregation protein Spo0J